MNANEFDHICTKCREITLHLFKNKENGELECCKCHYGEDFKPHSVISLCHSGSRPRNLDAIEGNFSEL